MATVSPARSRHSASTPTFSWATLTAQTTSPRVVVRLKWIGGFALAPTTYGLPRSLRQSATPLGPGIGVVGKYRTHESAGSEEEPLVPIEEEAAVTQALLGCHQRVVVAKKCRILRALVIEAPEIDHSSVPARVWSGTTGGIR